jgi:hypothetical protein
MSTRPNAWAQMLFSSSLGCGKSRPVLPVALYRIARLLFVDVSPEGKMPWVQGYCMGMESIVNSLQCLRSLYGLEYQHLKNLYAVLI